MNRIRYRLGLLAGLVSFISLVSGCVLSGAGPFRFDGFYELTAERPQVRLPLDEAPHYGTGFEWWYYTGRVTTDTTPEQVFGTHTVIFHVPPFPLGGGTDYWIAHYAIVNAETGEFVYDQSRITGGQPDPQPEVGFDIDGGLIQMRGSAGSDQFTAAMGDGRFALDIALQDTREPILHGGDGYVPHGLNGGTFYYSRPRMYGTGTLALDGEPVPVTGQFWFDRQWGLNFAGSLTRWAWFSIRLDDGTDLMLFTYGPMAEVAHGTLIEPDGVDVTLTAEDFAIVPLADWTSPETGITYQTQWAIDLPLDDIRLTLTAVAEAQELDVRPTTGNLYWEGLCTVTGTQGDRELSGHAFVEQANYGRPGDEQE